MSHYTKERNIITFVIDGTNGAYKFDLSNGQFLGLKGTPVKTCRKKTEIRRMLHNSNHYHGSWSNLERVLYNMFDYDYTSAYPRYLDMLKGAERLDAIDFTGDIWNIEDYVYIDSNFAYLNKYIQEELNGEQNQFRTGNFIDYVEFAKAKKELGGMAEQINAQMYRTVKQRIPNVTKEEWAVLIYYLVRGKYWEGLKSLFNKNSAVLIIGHGCFCVCKLKVKMLVFKISPKLYYWRKLFSEKNSLIY